MTTEEQLRANLASIQAAIASGVTRASYDGKSTEFRSLADMRSIRDGILRQLGEYVPPRRTVAAYSGGYS
jgi:hypothetical protein